MVHCLPPIKNCTEQNYYAFGGYRFAYSSNFCSSIPINRETITFANKRLQARVARGIHSFFFLEAMRVPSFVSKLVQMMFPCSGCHTDRTISQTIFLNICSCVSFQFQVTIDFSNCGQDNVVLKIVMLAVRMCRNYLSYYQGIVSYYQRCP